MSKRSTTDREQRDSKRTPKARRESIDRRAARRAKYATTGRTR